MKYNVKIIETLEKTIEVEADDPTAAEQIAEDEWHNGEHVLDADNFIEMRCEAILSEQNRAIDIVILEPGANARTDQVEAMTSSFEDIIRGPFLFLEMPNQKAAFVIPQNEKHRMPNRGIYNDKKEVLRLLRGTVFICGYKDKRPCSLTGEQIKKYLAQYRYPEKFFEVHGKIYGQKIKPKEPER